ncbi:hypothetical protein UFOVP239_39 [uncultured Caudovirales phage]|uniref:Uncharacterized protein n=1 Tax=uncultured Caudovirales phage TaxID=2100421 RepID=A0A6J7WQK8_9CAUD|nr:hypothetical protein UFOVP239_39 [uncultured Caudovirales phage]
MSEFKPTMRLRFVSREMVVQREGTYEPQSIRVLQQYFEPTQSFVGICDGEWRDVVLTPENEL